MTSHNERVNCSSLFLFFFYAEEILVERSLVIARFTTRQPQLTLSIVFMEQQ